MKKDTVLTVANTEMEEDIFENYLNLLHKRPDLIQRVPQYQLASYLGIKPPTMYIAHYNAPYTNRSGQFEN